MRGSITYTVTIKQLGENMTARERLAQAPHELVRLVAKEVVEEYIRATQHKNTVPEHKTTEPAKPVTGFMRLPQVLEVIPVGPTTWWGGVKSGRFPKPVKLSARCTAWRAEDIRKLAQEFSERGQKA